MQVATFESHLLLAPQPACGQKVFHDSLIILNWQAWRQVNELYHPSGPWSQLTNSSLWLLCECVREALYSTWKFADIFLSTVSARNYAIFLCKLPSPSVEMANAGNVLVGAFTYLAFFNNVSGSQPLSIYTYQHLEKVGFLGNICWLMIESHIENQFRT